MIVDALLAWLHFVLIFNLCGCLFAEAVFYRRELDGPTLGRLRSIDLAYGVLAAAVVASGIARVLFSPKGAAFYLHNPIFWTKMGLFVAVAALSVPPTLHFIALAKDARIDGGVTVGPRPFLAVRVYLGAEIVLLLLIPCCAAFMARGFGVAG